MSLLFHHAVFLLKLHLCCLRSLLHFMSLLLRTVSLRLAMVLFLLPAFWMWSRGLYFQVLQAHQSFKISFLYLAHLYQFLPVFSQGLSSWLQASFLQSHVFRSWPLCSCCIRIKSSFKFSFWFFFYTETLISTLFFDTFFWAFSSVGVCFCPLLPWFFVFNHLFYKCCPGLFWWLILWGR